MSANDTDLICALATDYALGLAGEEEARQFDEHLAAGCPLCAREVEALARISRLLAHAAEPVAPPPSLRGRLLGRVSRSTYWPEKYARFEIRADRTPWDTASVPGLAVKLLDVDRAARRRLTLVRARAGTYFPTHRHADVEELYILEGGLSFAEENFDAGDSVRMEPGSIHGPSETHEGCVLLICASLDDEILVG
jgi:quercetin dioxygenase-like cupin family protein